MGSSGSVPNAMLRLRRILPPPIVAGALAAMTAWALRGAAPAPAVAGGGTPGHAVSHWEMKDGLPLNKVRAVAQTPDGYLWVGTFNGLARFDGVRFKVFDVANTPALRHNGIESLGVDEAGRLWIGDNAGGLTLLADGRFRAMALPAEWTAKPVLRLVPARNGMVWAMNEEGTLVVMRDGAAAGVISLRAHPSLFAVDTAGTAWVVVGGGLQRLDPIAPGIAAANLQLDGRWQALFPGQAGGLWILHDGWLRRWQEGKWVEDRGRADWGTIVLAALIETRAGRIVGGSF
jgi:ligand-binding sensor domain-containing protein